MRADACTWEPEVLRTIAEGRWPERCEYDLREHLMGCGTCSDLIVVVAALARDRESAAINASIPSSGVVWWRTQLRMRREAERSAQRTVTFVQGAILGACSIVALLFLGWVWTPPAWVERVTLAVGGTGADPAAITLAMPWSSWLVLGLAAWISLILVAFRFALADDASGPVRRTAREGRHRVP